MKSLIPVVAVLFAGYSACAAEPPAASQPSVSFRVSFFGVATTQAERVVYIVNACGSLDRQFDYVKEELKQNIGKMAESQSFSVIMLHDVGIDEMGIGDEFGLFPATADNKKAGREWVQGRSAFSMGAYGDFARSFSRSLQRAFEILAGKPGAIYILDNGMLPGDPDKLLDRLNKERKVQVNTIQFVDRVPEGEKLMKRIAERNGGFYKFVSERELGR